MSKEQASEILELMKNNKVAIYTTPSNTKNISKNREQEIMEKLEGSSPQIGTAHQKQWSMLKNHKINYVFIFSILYHLSDYETKLGLACFGLF